MTTLYHVKMTSGSDYLGYIISDNPDSIEIQAPIEVVVSPTHGLFAKSVLMFSEVSNLDISKTNVMFMNVANKKAIEYYDEFMQKLHEQNASEGIEEKYNKELEDIFIALMESKQTTKH